MRVNLLPAIKMLGTISAKVTATPGESGWAQVHEFAPDDPEKLRLRGRLFAVVATKKVEDSSGSIDTIAAGRELIARLHEEYFGNLEEKPFNALKGATEKVIEEFKSSWGDVEIAVCAVVGDVAYSAAGGGPQVVICRKGALATILATKDEVASASGYPQKGDVMLLATKSFFEKISPGVIKGALESDSPEAAAETFAPMIHSEGSQGTLGAVVIKFDGKGEPLTEFQPQTSVLPSESTGTPEKAQTASVLKQKLTKAVENVLKLIPKRGVYVKAGVEDEVFSQNRKLTLSVGIILLLLLLVSVGFGIRQKGINDLRKKYQGILGEAQSEVDEAISLASVNPERSRELFIDSQQKLSQIEALKVKDPKVTDLAKKIEDSRGAILGEYEASPELFLDLSLLSSGFKGDKISSSGGNIFILDKSGKRVISVAADTKKSKVVAGPTVIDTAYDLASYQDNVFILTSDGVYQLGLHKTKVVDKTWSGEALIYAFAGNLYVLDKEGSSIYRYAGLPGGTFGTQQNWLASGTKVDFSGAISWTMDGAIYILFPNSKILKYSLGSPQGFSLGGVIPEIGNIDAICADPENQSIYLLDKAGKRVVAVDKKGKYKAQYKGDQIAGATALVASEAERKIILLTGDKLLSIEIKHL
jgi:hypothetical protein